MTTPREVVTVDISRLLMDKYPEFWHEPREGRGELSVSEPGALILLPRSPQRVRSTFHPFHFAFHEGKVLVGTWLAAPEATSSQGKVWNMYYPPLPIMKYIFKVGAKSGK